MLFTLAEWFWQLIEAVGFTPHYLGYVFVAMATGFLLKRFGSDLSLGSDKAEDAYKNSGNGKFSPRNRASRYGSGSSGGRYERK